MGDIRRGDIGLAAAAGDYGKPGPWLVVQADKYIGADHPDSILVCPFTSHQETLPYRVPVSLPYGDAVRASWAMTDKLMAVKRERIRASVGRVSPQELAAIESAIADLLGLVLAQ